jgi:Holliday junction resolvase RusA-like endonuclease
MWYQIDVEGIPVPQGSFRHIGNGRIIAANPKLNAWRETIATAINADPTAPYQIDQPTKVELVFILPRPKTVTRQNHTVKPDIDKLVRACLDAISLYRYSQCLTDDSYVTELHAAKRYTIDGWTGVRIKLFW